MIPHLVYKCPKCQNTLLVSNKMLHDLRCTFENPATYENIISQQNQDIINEASNYNSNLRNSSARYSTRMSIKHDDGTMTDFRKEKNMQGKEELVEIKYDPQGNVISRKKADNSAYNNQLNDNYQEVTDFYDFVDYDPNEYYEVNEENERKYNNMNKNINNIINNNEITYNNNQVIYQTAAPQEIVYEAPAQYDPNITINQPIEETVINSEPNLSHNTLNNIIRNSLSRANNMNSNSANLFNNAYSNEFNYSTQTNNINTSMYTQNINLNNLGNNQGLDLGNSNFGTDDVLRRTAGIGSNNFTNIQYPY